ncbi:hypothetical protein BKA93DRAFT_520867 [Sparassis latifolia]
MMLVAPSLHILRFYSCYTSSLSTCFRVTDVSSYELQGLLYSALYCHPACVCIE